MTLYLCIYKNYDDAEMYIVNAKDEQTAKDMFYRQYAIDEDYTEIGEALLMKTGWYTDIYNSMHVFNFEDIPEEYIFNPYTILDNISTKECKTCYKYFRIDNDKKMHVCPHCLHVE